MNIPATVFATVEADHTIRVPAHFPVGEHVAIVKIPSISDLLNDPERRARFAATRSALQNAINAGYPRKLLSDKEIVALVKRARRNTKA